MKNFISIFGFLLSVIMPIQATIVSVSKKQLGNTEIVILGEDHIESEYVLEQCELLKSKAHEWNNSGQKTDFLLEQRLDDMDIAYDSQKLFYTYASWIKREKDKIQNVHFIPCDERNTRLTSGLFCAEEMDERVMRDYRNGFNGYENREYLIDFFEECVEDNMDFQGIMSVLFDVADGVNMCMAIEHAESLIAEIFKKSFDSMVSFLEKSPMLKDIDAILDTYKSALKERLKSLNNIYDDSSQEFQYMDKKIRDVLLPSINNFKEFIQDAQCSDDTQVGRYMLDEMYQEGTFDVAANSIGVLVHDYANFYFVARVLSSCKSTAHRVVLYVGNNHAEDIKKDLDNLGAQEVMSHHSGTGLSSSVIEQILNSAE